ncbi:MAG TPA: short-chain dehydrogenase/reductase [Solirubrobacteraceae bacterium]|jgi:NAD(P)-dependent dehydrogenase (short-subunit alcohol dehydrogenase family)|nr:short-chain dehydrogenase/reductase [Solirubrobacteraceae bacterium]
MARSANDRYDVKGRTVFITGAARGIGKASAERLYAKGANVALVGLEPERLEENAARLGERAAWFEADVTDFDALERAVAGTVERFGGVDVAIANAGLAFMGALATAPIEQVERTLAVNLLGVWRTDRAVISQILERNGYLLNIASAAAFAHGPLMGPYTATKAGVEAMTDALRQESAPFGAAIGCAYFGFIDTDLVKAAYAARPTEILNQRAPGFIRNPIPLARAIDAIERGVERRSARVWAPRWVGPLMALRGLTQPLTERSLLRDHAELREAIRLVDPASGELPEQDPTLGVAAAALTQPERTPISQ